MKPVRERQRKKKTSGLGVGQVHKRKRVNGDSNVLRWLKMDDEERGRP